MATATVEPSSRTHRRRPRPHRVPIWRRARRVILFACLFCLAAAALSWLPAVSGSRNLSLSIASVEWLRSHGGNPIATQIENWYYQLNEPEKGGPTLTSLPQVGDGTATPVEGEGGEGSGEAAPYSPPDVNPLIHPKLPGEGVWQKAGAKVGAEPPVLLTTFRSDPEYPQFVDGVAWMSAPRTELVYTPGTAETAEPLEDRGSGEVPRHSQAPGRHLQRRLPAGNLERRAGLPRQGGRIDGERDRHRGRLPRRRLRHRQMGEWNEGAERLVREAEPAADHLRRQAEDWTSFISYRHPAAIEPSNLLPEMYRSPERYLVPDERDFFAVYLKAGRPW